MLGFFRRFIKSRIGVPVTLAVLVVIAIAFAAGDISGVRQNAGPTGNTVATVAGTDISDRELTDRARQELDAVRQRNPALDMSQFIAAGGLESVLERFMTSVALQAFADKADMQVAPALIDGQIASIPAFQGFDGKFDQKTFETQIAQRGMTARQLREDFRSEILAQWLLAPTIGATQMPEQVALPYASLLKEQRAGQVTLIPTTAVPEGAAPTEAELQTYYKRNRARYTVPERRVMRYALVSADALAKGATPTEAELQQAFRAGATRFAASEQRTLRQVIVADQAAANRIAGQVRGGTAVDQAAQAAGLEATTLEAVSKQALTSQASAAVADAAFAAGEGQVVGPVRSPLGFHVLRVESITRTPARTFAQARDELLAEVRETKAKAAINQAQERIDAAITDGATFDEIVTENRLAAQRTPAVTAAGADPLNPEQRTPPELTRVVQAGFAVEEGDAPQIVQTAEDGSFAVVGLERTIAAAPRPLADIRQRVADALVAERRFRTARTAAAQIVAKVNAGTPLAQAVQASSVPAETPRPLRATRAALAQQQGQVPPPLVLMFAMAEKKAKLVAAPDNAGWFVVYLDQITPGDAKGDQRAVASTRAGLGQVQGRELTEQFARAVRQSVGAERNAAAVARVRADLSGTGQTAN